MKQEVLLVTPDDEPAGTMEKMEAHQKGLLHRAFSVFIFDANGRMLLQQRSANKYHGGLLWTNACCSHPAISENVNEAAERRLEEELGFTTPLKKIFAFTYKAQVENELTEHEYDHVFTGEYEGEIIMNREEVNDYTYLSFADLSVLLHREPQRFTTWFRIAFPQIEAWWQKQYVVV